ncbi:ABC transporter permease subunit [Sulfolobus tengchongensis]|uniref:ABC transporter permease subunit n=1 Tax=Sulfolobus tengchongensis TaxID=207809 RepID=A0AAX4L413_9CREN
MEAKTKRTIYITTIQIASIVIFFLIWQYLVQSGIVSTLFLAPPSSVIVNSPNILREPFVYTRILFTIWITISAFIFTIVIGTLIGLLLGLFMYLRSTFEPYMLLLYSIPKAIFIPIFWTLFGLGFSYQFWFAAFGGIIPMVINVMYGVKDIDPQLVNLAKSYGAKSYQIYYKIILPSILPSVLGGARISLRSVLADVIAAEEFVGTTGVGYLAQYYASNFLTVELYTVVVVVALIGMALYYIISRIEKRVLKWNVTLG